MKSKNYILSVLAIGLMTGSMVSCSDFLDTKPSTSVDDTDVFQTTSGAQSALNGCYYQMRAYGSGGANRGDDYGIPSIQMISDMCGEDVMNNGSGWYLYNYNYWGETQANIFRTDQLWTFHYRLVNNLNSVITYVDDSEGEDMDISKGRLWLCADGPISIWPACISRLMLSQRTCREFLFIRNRL